eukprot:gnl/Dysnectes_brevis/7338_a12212_234.p1 GENE.gnl/Dysnectes_brevis/7338_a12212_234~~gnl/Dysnectes_brevis/7338_a12212_234.p1  ORF type:complete len:184 (-),score=23.87 gnl/Dysnectes_brevis/7338_a12212_234:19-570(-)
MSDDESSASEENITLIGNDDQDDDAILTSTKMIIDQLPPEHVKDESPISAILRAQLEAAGCLPWDKTVKELQAERRPLLVPYQSYNRFANLGSLVVSPRALHVANKKITVVMGDLTIIQTDAIILPAAHDLSSGGSELNALAHARAGPALCRELRRVGGGMSIGQATVTPGFGLSARYVVHTL